MKKFYYLSVGLVIIAALLCILFLPAPSFAKDNDVSACNQLSNVSEKDTCFRKLAIQTKNSELCNRASNAMARSYCRGMVIEKICPLDPALVKKYCTVQSPLEMADIDCGVKVVGADQKKQMLLRLTAGIVNSNWKDVAATSIGARPDNSGGARLGAIKVTTWDEPGVGEDAVLTTLPLQQASGRQDLEKQGFAMHVKRGDVFLSFSSIKRDQEFCTIEQTKQLAGEVLKTLPGGDAVK